MRLKNLVGRTWQISSQYRNSWIRSLREIFLHLWNCIANDDDDYISLVAIFVTIKVNQANTLSFVDVLLIFACRRAAWNHLHATLDSGHPTFYMRLLSSRAPVDDMFTTGSFNLSQSFCSIWLHWSSLPLKAHTHTHTDARARQHHVNFLASHGKFYLYIQSCNSRVPPTFW